MTEDVKPTGEEEVKQEEVQLSPIQEKALSQGWKPRDQFEGSDEEFIDAPEFVRRGELFGKIETQSRELKTVRQALDALKQFQSQIAEREYQRALKSLQETRKQAFVEGDTEKAFAIEEQIDEVKQQAAEIRRQAQAPVVQELAPEFVAWTEKNPWYNTNKAMRAAADSIGLEHARAGVPQAEVLKLVEKAIREEFPHKFSNPNRERPNAVESSSRTGTSVQRASGPVMNDQERDIMRKIVRSGVMTEAEYIAEFKKMKG